MKILGLCGSLRKNSSNYFLLRAAAQIFSSHEWTEFNIEDLPYFDPDAQFSDNLPASVTTLRALGSQSDLVFISTPEYAHGAPGILKNALEWLFHEGTQKKPVALVIGSAQGNHTQAQLIEILTTMDFIIAKENTLLLNGLRSKIDASGNFINDEDKTIYNNFCQTFI